MELPLLWHTLVHAAGEAGVVGSHELFHPQTNIGLGGAFRNHLLGENAHVAFEVRDVLRRGREDRRMLHATFLVEFQVMEEHTSRSLGEPGRTPGAHLEGRRRARTRKAVVALG